MNTEDIYLKKIIESLDSINQRLDSLENKINTLIEHREQTFTDNNVKTELSNNPVSNADELTESQQRAFEYLKTGKNCFITGGAGVGKTFLLNRFISYCDSHGLRTMKCASTGIAAQNLGGVTIHSQFRLPITYDPGLYEEDYVLSTLYSKGNLFKILRRTDVIIIDEISMCRVDTFTAVMSMLKAFMEESQKSIQIVLCGDFCQLPPVITSNDQNLIQACFPENENGYCFKSKLWNEIGFKTLLLEEVVRQSEPDYVSALNMLRIGNINGYKYICKHSSGVFEEDAVTLFTKNADADHFNLQRINELPGEMHIFECIADAGIKDSDINVPKVLSLKKNTRVMCLLNNEDMINGDLGTVVDFKTTKKGSLIYVKLDKNNKIICVEPNRYELFEYVLANDDKTLTLKSKGGYTQFPLKPAYAMTVHKSQGCTFPKVNLLSKSFFVPGQLYVALSRCRSLKTLHLEIGNNFYPSRKKLINDDVLEFYKETV